MQNTIKKPELLAPAGNLEKLKMAILYGAMLYILAENVLDFVLMAVIFLKKK